MTTECEGNTQNSKASGLEEAQPWDITNYAAVSA